MNINYDYFQSFVKESNRDEVLNAKLVNNENYLMGMFFIDTEVSINNTTNLPKKDFLRRQYRSLVDLFLINQNYNTSKKINIIIKPDLD